MDGAKVYYNCEAESIFTVIDSLDYSQLSKSTQLNEQEDRSMSAVSDDDDENDDDDDDDDDAGLAYKIRSSVRLLRYRLVCSV
ncbi:hypothetical protein T4D_13146 [Trichinella pseudospiralis]|uniref:Uncharacterized protein n=1 Tax=Trichinella pseudospiralis TaxID=6337 RepID=A0A0V1FTW5_TRIPS|nr:hypothetical protein T4D_13146 [Trichinella pseudospiralis]